MENWGRKFGLVEVRKKAASDTEFWGNKENYKFLTSEIAMKTEQYLELPPWTRATTRAAAVGLTVDTAVVAGKAAARLWGIEVLGWDPLAELMHVDGRKPGSRKTWGTGVQYRYCHLDRSRVHTEHGIRVTDVLRTLQDITRYHGLMDGVVAIDSARKIWPHLSVTTLSAGMTSAAPYKGIGLVRSAIELSIPNSGSALESRARLLLMEANLPQVTSIQAQARFFYDSGRRYFDVDLLINGWLIVEIDGEIKYDGKTFGKKTEDVLMDERRRERILQNAGKYVIRVGHEHLIPRADGRCALIDLVENAFRTFLVPTAS